MQNLSLIYFFFHMKSLWLDQVLVKFLIYHTIIVAPSESQQSSDLMQLVPELSGCLQMWCIIKQIVFFRHGFGETATIIHCVCAPFNNDAMPHVALVSGVRWSCQAKSSPAYISTHTHQLPPLRFFFPPLGDRALITHPSPSAPVIRLLCPAQMKSGTYITAHIIASTLINTELTHTHTYIHTQWLYTIGEI